MSKEWLYSDEILDSGGGGKAVRRLLQVLVKVYTVKVEIRGKMINANQEGDKQWKKWRKWRIIQNQARKKKRKI